MKEQLKSLIIDALANLHKRNTENGSHPLGEFRLCEIVHELIESDVPFAKQAFLEAMCELIDQSGIEIKPVNKAQNHRDNPLFVDHFAIHIPRERRVLRTVEGSWLGKQLEENSREVRAWPAVMRLDRNCPCTKIVHALIGIHDWEEELKGLLSLRQSVG